MTVVAVYHIRQYTFPTKVDKIGLLSNCKFKKHFC